MKWLYIRWNKLLCWWYGIHYWQFTGKEIVCKCGAELKVSSLIDGLSTDEREKLFELSAKAEEDGLCGGDDEQ